MCYFLSLALADDGRMAKARAMAGQAKKLFDKETPDEQKVIAAGLDRFEDWQLLLSAPQPSDEEIEAAEPDSDEVEETSDDGEELEEEADAPDGPGP